MEREFTIVIHQQLRSMSNIALITEIDAKIADLKKLRRHAVQCVTKESQFKKGDRVLIKSKSGAIIMVGIIVAIKFKYDPETPLVDCYSYTVQRLDPLYGCKLPQRLTCDTREYIITKITC